MKDRNWLFHRLKSMNGREVVWRVQQKLLQKREYRKLYQLHLPVTEIPLRKGLIDLKPDRNRIPFNKDNKNHTLFTSLDLLASFDYREYKTKWNAGFQTDNRWPETEFSYGISIGQREDIGDIRTNWELNRHYQFACLAKNYYLTGDADVLRELTELFSDWNRHNLFLHGVQWTSPMELGIRSLSWIYTYLFLTHAAEKYNTDIQGLMEQIRHGLLCMADYITKHRARYSSANNHLIIEIFAVGMVGILFQQSEWIRMSVRILTEELPRQNQEDGVNKEMSLHYQSFVMEAYGILWLALEKNHIRVPEIWKTYLTAMSRYVSDCCGDYGETIVFGDNDEGKLLDLQGKFEDYDRYVLQLMGVILEQRYTDDALAENISWLISEQQKRDYFRKKIYKPGAVCSYQKGGYTILRSKDRKVLIGMDHAELGFGSIAAHGHADALSIQLFFEGKPILVDGGTYNYHVPKECRDEFRSTKAHNTVYVEEVEQAKMLGPFLWGKRYRVENVTAEEKENGVQIKAAVSYSGIRHIRKLWFDQDRKLIVEDKVVGADQASQIWNVNQEQALRLEKNAVRGNNIVAASKNIFEISESIYSEKYGKKKSSERIAVQFDNGKVQTEFSLGDG